MKADQVNPKWEDIIFEKRNKLYGAYELRSTYNDRITKSFFITIAGASILFLFIFLLRTKPKPKLFTETKVNVVFSDQFDVEDLIQPVKIKPEIAGSTPSRPDVNSFLLVTDSEKTDKLIDTTTTGFVSNTDTSKGVLPGNHVSDTFALTVNQPPSKKPYNLSVVDKVPDFPGGLEKFYKFLINRIHYTNEARMADVVAKMFVSFVVDEQGLISEVKVIRKVGYGLDEQVSSVLLESPKWTPGFYKNTPVKTEMVLPVSFNLVK